MIEGTELLAPARDLACGRIAVDAGADAVYIGAPRFGARARAGNALEDISALVDYAHQFWARVYVTVNTLLHDNELPEAVDLIVQLHAIGVDAIIIQDVGLLECDLPPIPLIASTQMHNTTPERVRFLEAVGFQRAILARELSLEQIQSIRNATQSIELETFVHGALCVSYSGQCYMSYAIGGRSGNRGDCAQPCRRVYSLVDSRGRVLVADRYLLSLRDMNRVTDLGALLDAGVSSFKIEGRLKDETYVANVVAAYRQALDMAALECGLDRSSSGKTQAAFEPDLRKTFNRGYTGYYLYGQDDSPGAIDSPKMVGESVGTVVEVEPRTFVMESTATLHRGDGIAFYSASGRLQGTVINQVQSHRRGLRVTPNSLSGIRPGTAIYRNHDHAYLTDIMKSLPVRTIGVRFALGETADGFSLTVEDSDGCTASVVMPMDKTVARKPKQAEDTARAQIAKTGNSIFHAEEVTISWSGSYFLPYSALNALRRLALDALIKARAARRPVLTSVVVKNAVPYTDAKLTYRGNVLNDKARAFYQRHGATQIEPAAESGLDMRQRIIMTTRYCLKRQLGWCPLEANVIHIEEPLSLVDEEGHYYHLSFRCTEWPHQCGMDIVY